MLTEAIKQNITPLSLSELEPLCEEFLAKNGGHTEEEFIADLFKRKRITANEFKNIQAHGKIELTSIASITDISDIAKKLSDTGGHKITGTYVENEDYTILESIDEGAMDEILLARDNKLNRYVVNKINKGQSGHYFYIERGREKIIAYSRLNSTGWYFVAKADAEELLTAM